MVYLVPTLGCSAVPSAQCCTDSWRSVVGSITYDHGLRFSKARHPWLRDPLVVEHAIKRHGDGDDVSERRLLLEVLGVRAVRVHEPLPRAGVRLLFNQPLAHHQTKLRLQRTHRQLQGCPFRGLARNRHGNAA